MGFYTIRREVGDVPREEIDASGLRAIVCAFEYPGLRWIRSYWDRDRGELLCLYEADDADQIREHSERSRIPCEEVREVVEIYPEEYTHG